MSNFLTENGVVRKDRINISSRKSFKQIKNKNKKINIFLKLILNILFVSNKNKYNIIFSFNVNRF